jgi:hypothetical protein
MSMALFTVDIIGAVLSVNLKLLPDQVTVLGTPECTNIKVTVLNRVFDNVPDMVIVGFAVAVIRKASAVFADIFIVFEYVIVVIVC